MRYILLLIFGMQFYFATAQIDLNANFKPAIAAPLDIRNRVQSVNELNSLPFSFDGLLCYVLEEEKFYVQQGGIWNVFNSGSAIDTAWNHLALKPIRLGLHPINNEGVLGRGLYFLPGGNARFYQDVTIGNNFYAPGSTFLGDNAADLILLNGKIQHNNLPEKIEATRVAMWYETNQGNYEMGYKNASAFIGATGPAGAKGDKGDIGATGLTGAKGDKGDIGATGLTGAKGDKGDIGATGLTGAKGDKGDIGATGLTGAKGDKGDIGATGLTGAKGDKGDIGATGLTGAKGDKGDIGATGPAGVKGDKGDIGATGPAGVKGDKGDIGATGPAGVKGDKGDIGATGLTGAKGEKGDKGDSGDAINQMMALSPLTNGVRLLLGNDGGEIDFINGLGFYFTSNGNKVVGNANATGTTFNAFSYDAIQAIADTDKFVFGRDEDTHFAVTFQTMKNSLRDGNGVVDGATQAGGSLSMGGHDLYNVNNLEVEGKVAMVYETIAADGALNLAADNAHYKILGDATFVRNGSTPNGQIVEIKCENQDGCTLSGSVIVGTMRLNSTGNVTSFRLADGELAVMKLKDMNWDVSKSIVAKAGINYSTIEQITEDTDLEGNPIYQNTFEVTSIQDGATHTFLFPGSYQIKRQEWGFIRGGTKWNGAGSINTSFTDPLQTAYIYQTGATSASLKITNNTGFALSNVELTVRYTK